MNLVSDKMSLNNSIEWMTSQGFVDYEEALSVMNERVSNIEKGHAPELIWFLEHPSIYTFGTSAQPHDLIGAPQCPLYKTGRGGQITYHGPGQRIVYLMLDLRKRNPDIRNYVYLLESWILQTLKVHSISAYRRKGRIGLWVPRTSTKDDKIAAIGIRVRKWISLHGLAINVNPDLDFYKNIIPCGIREHGVTSMHTLGQKLTMADLDQTLKETFDSIFKA